eukprot:2541710-Rhodomonas_salina.3
MRCAELTTPLVSSCARSTWAQFDYALAPALAISDPRAPLKAYCISASHGEMKGTTRDSVGTSCSEAGPIKWQETYKRNGMEWKQIKAGLRSNQIRSASDLGPGGAVAASASPCIRITYCFDLVAA